MTGKASSSAKFSCEALWVKQAMRWSAEWQISSLFSYQTDIAPDKTTLLKLSIDIPQKTILDAHHLQIYRCGRKPKAQGTHRHTPCGYTHTTAHARCEADGRKYEFRGNIST